MKGGEYDKEYDSLKEQMYMNNKSGGIGCGTMIVIAIIVLIIIGSMSSGGSSKKSSYSSSSSYYDSQQFRDDYNYFKGRYDAMTGQ